MIFSFLGGFISVFTFLMARNCITDIKPAQHDEARVQKGLAYVLGIITAIGIGMIVYENIQ